MARQLIAYLILFIEWCLISVILVEVQRCIWYKNQKKAAKYFEEPSELHVIAIIPISLINLFTCIHLKRANLDHGFRHQLFRFHHKTRCFVLCLDPDGAGTIFEEEEGMMHLGLGLVDEVGYVCGAIEDVNESVIRSRDSLGDSVVTGHLKNVEVHNGCAGIDLRLEAV